MYQSYGNLFSKCCLAICMEWKRSIVTALFGGPGIDSYNGQTLFSKGESLLLFDAKYIVIMYQTMASALHYLLFITALRYLALIWVLMNHYRH